MTTELSSTTINPRPDGDVNTAAISSTTSDRVHLTIKDLSITGVLSQPQTKQYQSSLTASFRGIKYADIPGRWHEAVLRDLASQKGVLEATEWGPRPPQSVDLMHATTAHLYPRLSIHDPVSEFDCLNLNIYTPLTAITPASDSSARGCRLPVLFWIHGGSFEWGDGGSEFGEFVAVAYNRPLDPSWPIFGNQSADHNGGIVKTVNI